MASIRMHAIVGLHKVTVGLEACNRLGKSAPDEFVRVSGEPIAALPTHGVDDLYR
jgi:hypothetical protein